jgi:hypothetical protein
MNLAEGNFVRNIVIDDSHGKNGPLNTFFRNRASGYGIFMNFMPATDSVQFIGNEITNSTIGLNFIQGVGHFLYGNNYRGSIVSGSAAIPDTSLYLPAGQKPLCPAGYSAWPVAGRPGGFNTGMIYAQARVQQGKPAACACVPVPAEPTGVTALSSGTDITIFPNPAGDYFELRGSRADRVSVHDGAGRLVLTANHPAGGRISSAGLAPGLYTVSVLTNGNRAVLKLVKQ